MLHDAGELSHVYAPGIAWHHAIDSLAPRVTHPRSVAMPRRFTAAVFVFSVALSALASAADPWEVYEPWPFDAAEAHKRQADTAKAIGQPAEFKLFVNGKEGPTLNFRLIPAGKFLRGSPKTENGHEGDETLRP